LYFILISLFVGSLSTVIMILTEIPSLKKC
jgi:hypothetical protein